MGYSSLKMFLFPKLFKDLMSIQSLLLWGRERGQKGPADAETALQHIPFSLGRDAEQILLPSKSFYLCPSPPCTLTWQQVEVCKGFHPLLLEQIHPILRAAKFTEERSEMASLEL